MGQLGLRAQPNGGRAEVFGAIGFLQEQAEIELRVLPQSVDRRRHGRRRQPPTALQNQNTWRQPPGFAIIYT